MLSGTSNRPGSCEEASSEVSTPLVPARMVNEFVYCARLAYLMWRQSEWAETGDTVDGRRVHRRADRAGTPVPDPEDRDPAYAMIVSRSLTLSSGNLRVIAKIDIAEMRDGGVVVVDYKRGKRPHGAQGVFDPERVQLCLHALLLEEHGYRVDGGAIFFAESRERVPVGFDSALRRRTRAAVAALRVVAESTRPPPPLVDSPKCPRCALVSVCLPDEVNWLLDGSLAPRAIAVPADDALPLIVQAGFGHIGKQGDRLTITVGEGKHSYARLIDVSDVAIFGNVSITTPALHVLMEREIPVTFHSFGGWFKGMTQGIGHKNVDVRTAQYRTSFDEGRCRRFARDLVAAKIHNQRTMLRRNWRGDERERRLALDRLALAIRKARRATDLASLLGIEGDAAATYFRSFARLLAPPEGRNEFAGTGLPPFRFESRSRRPPADPVNALLSLAYSMLTRHVTIALASVGLDPYRGLYHGQRYGRPALALDIMEPFRSIVSDSVVLTAINTGETRPRDFLTGRIGTSLTAPGRRRFIEAFERRLSLEAIHPVFGYRLSMRRTILVQARLLARFLTGELPSYPHYLPR